MNTSTVSYRQLGRSGIQVTALGMGCWAIGGSGWGTVNDEESIRAIHAALDYGITFFDTADVYGTGHSEQIVAKALAGKRDKVVIATKFGNGYPEIPLKFSDSTAPEYIRKACELSLRRLNTDYIDLYQFHLNDYPVDKAASTRETLEALVAEGKIRAYGWSTDFPDRARFFGEGKHCASIQVELNVIDDAPDIIAVCEEMNLAAINRGPLAMGLLTGKYRPSVKLPSDDVRGENAPDWMKYFKNGEVNPVWLKKLDTIRDILSSNGRTLAQGALAWLWARSEKTIPIPGFKTVAQVQENCGALKFGPLTAEQMKEIEALRQ